MTDEILHSVEIAANGLAIAVEPLRNVETTKAQYAREIARICAIGIFDVLNCLEGGEDQALEDTIDVLNAMLREEEDDEED